MALRNTQGQRGKYLTLELVSTRNPVEDMYAIVSKFQSAKIGDEVDEQIGAIPKHPEAHLWPSEIITLGLLHGVVDCAPRQVYKVSVMVPSGKTACKPRHYGLIRAKWQVNHW